jgi:hypothetical protein
MSTIETESTPLVEADEIAVRRAVAGVDADILAAGGTAEQAEAVRSALRYYLLGEHCEARRELAKAYPEDMVEQFIEQFKQGAAAAAPTSSRVPRAAWRFAFLRFYVPDFPGSKPAFFGWRPLPEIAMSDRIDEPGSNERQLQVGRRAAQRATEFILERENSEGGFIGRVFGTRHQSQNILAVVVISLILMIGGTIVGSVMLKDPEIFKTMGALLVSTLTTILGYLFGSRQRA